MVGPRRKSPFREAERRAVRDARDTRVTLQCQWCHRLAFVQSLTLVAGHTTTRRRSHGGHGKAYHPLARGGR